VLQVDLELIAGLDIQHGGAGHANQEIAVALHGGHIGELASTFADSASTCCAEIDAFGFKESFVERGEIEMLATALLVRVMALGMHHVPSF